MYLKMLKKDLQSGKSLNIIILLFMIIVPVLLVAGAIEIYGNTVGNKETGKMMNLADITMIFETYDGKTEEFFEAEENFRRSHPGIMDHSCEKLITTNRDHVDFQNVDEEKNMYLNEHMLFFSKQHERISLFYNMDDELFSVENGSVAIPYSAARAFGSEKGDKVKLTDQTGNVHEFVISEIYKTMAESYYSYLIFSDDDFELLLKDSSKIRYKIDYIVTDQQAIWNEMLFFVSECSNNKNALIISLFFSAYSVDDMVVAVSVFMLIICIFLMFIVLVSVRFTLLSAIRSEIREIGMLRVCGADSAAFRILFAVKYFVFTFFGGAAGIIIGIPCGKMILKYFSTDLIIPERTELITVSVLSVAAFTVLMSLYIFIMMRHIGKVTVMDMLHGENRGERFGKNTLLFMHRLKKMPVAVYLAVSDILNSIRRYIFLILIYSVGTMVILLGFHLKNTVESKEYQKYYLVQDIDFSLDLYNKNIKNILQDSENHGEFFNGINRILSENDIDASISGLNNCPCRIKLSSDTEIDALMKFGEYDPAQFEYLKGGSVPLLKNEVAVCAYSAYRYGLEVGDRISIRYNKSINESETEEVTEEFLITALHNSFDSGYCDVICSAEFEGAEVRGTEIVSMKINGNKKDYKKTIEKMNKVLGEGSVLSWEESQKQLPESIMPALRILKLTVLLVTVFITALVTLLHYNVLFHEEKKSVALLRCTGFTTGSIKAWLLIRNAILVIVSSEAGSILSLTLGNVIAAMVYRKMGLFSFRFVTDPVDTFLTVPAIITAVVMIMVLINVRKINNTELSDLNCE